MTPTRFMVYPYGCKANDETMKGSDRMATTQMTTSITVVEDVKVLDSTNVEYLIKELNEAKKMEKDAAERRAAADKAIRALMGDATVGVVGGAERVRLVEVERSGVDSKKLQEGWADAYAACRKVTTYTRLDTK